MIGRSVLAAALLLSAGGSIAAPRTLSVAEVVARHKVLAGKTVRVTGWISPCYRLGCMIYGATGPDRAGNDPAYLSLGASSDFDRSVANYAGRKVVVEGRVTGNCFLDVVGDTIIICTDRADQFADPHLIKVFPESAGMLRRGDD